MSKDDRKQGNQSLVFQELDFSHVEFPSDRLTMLDLRRLKPELFDKGFHFGLEAQPQYFLKPNRPGHASGDLGILLMSERILLAGAYATAKGHQSSDWNLRETSSDLRNMYCRFGLASGPKSAELLIKEIQQQGENLAKTKGF